MRALGMDDAALQEPPDLREASGQPAHMRIEQWLEQRITTGELRAEDRLPAEVEIAHALGVSRMTLRQALSSLESKGLLLRKRGRWGGNFVAQPKVELDLSGLPGFTEQLRRAHVQAGARVLQATTHKPSTEVREALQLKRGAVVYEIIRVRSANDDPIALEESYYPAAVFPDLLSKDLTVSLYALLQEYGRAPYSATEVLEPVKASSWQADLLTIKAGDPLMRITRTAFAVDGQPVEHAHDYFRADRTRITLRTQVDRQPRAEILAHPSA